MQYAVQSQCSGCEFDLQVDLYTKIICLISISVYI